MEWQTLTCIFFFIFKHDPFVWQEISHDCDIDIDKPSMHHDYVEVASMLLLNY